MCPCIVNAPQPENAVRGLYLREFDHGLVSRLGTYYTIALVRQRLTSPLLVRLPPITVPSLLPPPIIPALGFGVDVAQLGGAKSGDPGESNPKPCSSMFMGSPIGSPGWVSWVPAVVEEMKDVVGAALLLLAFPDAVIKDMRYS